MFKGMFYFFKTFVFISHLPKLSFCRIQTFFFYFKKFLIKHADTVGLILTCSFAIGEQKVGCKLRRRIRRRTKRLRRRKMEKRKKRKINEKKK